MRAAQYSRVSSKKQANNTSIANQLKRCEAYIEAQGWELVKTYIEPGESGENLDRPAMTAARQGARRGEYDVLVVYVLDRLTRDLDDLFLLRREFASEGVNVWAVHDGLDVTTADVDDLLRVLFRGYFGHKERTDILRRTAEGIESHVKKGKFAGGVPPFGYQTDEHSRLVVHEPNARIVRMIFDWAADGISARQIAHRLNGLEIPGPQQRRGHKTKKRWNGTQDPIGWTHATVALILHSETYVGRWTYGKRGSAMPKIVVDVPPIVDQKKWESAQAALKKNRRNTKPSKHRYLLRGLIQCECGASYCCVTPRREGGPHWYRCLARYDYRKIHRKEPCNSLTVRGSELEEAIWSDIEEFVRQPHLVAADLERRREPAGAGLAAQLAKVDQALAERKAERVRYLDLYGKGLLPVEELEAKAEEVAGHIAVLETYRAGLAEEQRRTDLWEREVAGIVEALAVLQEKLDSGLSWEDKRDLVERLVKGVVVETSTDEAGERYATAHVTYRFERPVPGETPIPIELEPLFAGIGTGINCQTRPVVLSYPLLNFRRLQNDTIGTCLL